MEEEARHRRRGWWHQAANSQRNYRLPGAFPRRRRPARNAAPRQPRARPPPRRERVSSCEAEFPDHPPRQGLYAVDARARSQVRPHRAVGGCRVKPSVAQRRKEHRADVLAGFAALREIVFLLRLSSDLNVAELARLV